MKMEDSVDFIVKYWEPLSVFSLIAAECQHFRLIVT